jgi:nicotinate phosphoribosyltransferase
MKTRLSAQCFRLPVHELRCGYRSDVYFQREKQTLEQHGLHPEVTMQVFQRNDAVLCGMDEALAVLRLASGHYSDPKRAQLLLKTFLQCPDERVPIGEELEALWQDGFTRLSIDALFDGAEISPDESVMHITGDASLFAHLETVYLGILARRTRIATNVRRAAEAAGGKPVLYFPARFDHWSVQEGDGYAAMTGGAFGVSTAAQTAWTGTAALGTVPHALIASVGGDTVKAVELFHATWPEVNLIALVDFDNDCITTSLDCCEALGDRLWGVRLDTAADMTDLSATAPGVTPELVDKTRKALDARGFDKVKIVASGGFTAERIEAFEKQNAPVDAYGVGSSLMRGVFDFTADVVLLDGKPCAKTGRRFRPNPRLQRVE